MLREFFAHIGDINRDDDMFVRIEAFQVEGQDASVQLRIMDYDQKKIYSRWLVTAVGMVDYAIVPGPWGDVNLKEPDHQLDLQHTDTQQELSFQGIPASPAAVVGGFVRVHYQVGTRWIPFERYFEHPKRFEKMLAKGSGVLGVGPAFLMEAYAGVLKEAGIEPSLRTVLSQPFEGKVLPATLIIGDCFLVATDFTAKRLDGDGLHP